MSKRVKTRPYHSPRRREAAERTRRAILGAATRLFVERGYVATTMTAIAAEAGVALDTVYAVVGPKPALFRLLIEAAISGTDQPVPAEERNYVREILAEPDPRRKLERYARAVRETQGRLAPLFRVLRQAASAEPELARLWQEIAERRAQNMRRLVADVVAAGGLRKDVSADEAADLIWATNSSEFYTLLVFERGWGPERYERWLATAWVRLLLRDSLT